MVFTSRSFLAVFETSISDKQCEASLLGSSQPVYLTKRHFVLVSASYIIIFILFLQSGKIKNVKNFVNTAGSFRNIFRDIF